jgi:hypothetical protein
MRTKPRPDPTTATPGPATSPVGVFKPADAIDPTLVFGRPVVPIHERLTWGLDDLSALTGLSRRTLERERSAGRLPPPDARIGRRVLWTRATLLTWLEKGGR